MRYLCVRSSWCVGRARTAAAAHRHRFDAATGVRLVRRLVKISSSALTRSPRIGYASPKGRCRGKTELCVAQSINSRLRRRLITNVAHLIDTIADKISSIESSSTSAHSSQPSFFRSGKSWNVFQSCPQSILSVIISPDALRRPQLKLLRTRPALRWVAMSEGPLHCVGCISRNPSCYVNLPRTPAHPA